jgi:hypothetical protein
MGKDEKRVCIKKGKVLMRWLIELARSLSTSVLGDSVESSSEALLMLVMTDRCREPFCVDLFLAPTMWLLLVNKSSNFIRHPC